MRERPTLNDGVDHLYANLCSDVAKSGFRRMEMPELRRYAAAAEQHSGLYMLAAAELYIREERCAQLLKKMGSGPWWCSTEHPVY